MRIDATIPDPDGKALTRLAKELGLSKSELVSEAVSHFLRLSSEVRAGRLLLLHDPLGGLPPRELLSRHLGAVTAKPNPLKRVAKRVLGQRPSRSADRAWADELARVRKLTPYERLAEGFELGDDDFGASR